MKHEGRFSRIISAIFGNKVAIRENLFYDTVKGNLDFAPDDLPNMRAVLAVVSGGGLAPTTIIAGTTDTPLVVAYDATSEPSYTLIKTTPAEISANANAAIGAVSLSIVSLPVTIPPGTALTLNTGTGQAIVVTNAVAGAGSVTLAINALTVAIVSGATYFVIPNQFDWNTNVMYDGANFTIYGATEDGTTFADSFTFAIKP